MSNAMNIKLDKNYISCAGLNGVKERVKEFKSMFTVQDLLRMFADQVYGQYDFYGDIIANNIEVIEQGSPVFGDATNRYDVTIYIEARYGEITKVGFWIDQNGEVSNDMWEVTTYQRSVCNRATIKI